MTESALRATPMSRSDIRRIADKLRSMLGLETKPYFPIVQVIEGALDLLVPGFVYDIRTKAEMGADHGLTDHIRKMILIREDVYRRACDGQGRDRGTLAHELGHAIMHAPTRLARRHSTAPLKPYRDPEWQAMAFQGELLVYHRLARRCSGPAEAAKVFGVSEDSAEVQWRTYKKEGLI